MSAEVAPTKDDFIEKDCKIPNPASIIDNGKSLSDRPYKHSATSEETSVEEQNGQYMASVPTEEGMDKKPRSQPDFASEDARVTVDDYIHIEAQLAEIVSPRLRLWQSMSYFKLVEGRISNLEAKVRGLRRESTPSKDEDENAFPKEIPDIEYLTWEEFAPQMSRIATGKETGNRKHRAELSLDPKFVIEVLHEEPRYGFMAKVRPNLVDNISLDPMPKNATSSLRSDTNGYPTLIRIRSKTLLKVIQEVTKCTTATGPHQHRLLLLRPFKLLTTYADQLRKRLKELDDSDKENKHQGRALTASRPSCPLIL